MPLSVVFAASTLFKGEKISKSDLGKINLGRLRVGALPLKLADVNGPRARPLPKLLYPHYDPKSFLPLLRGFSHHFFLCLKVAIRIYVPVYLVPMLIRPMAIAKRPFKAVWRFAVNVFRSAIFCGANVSVCGLILASMRRDALGSLSGWVGGLLGGLTLLLEKESRRTELTLYWLPIAFKAYRKVFEKFNIVRIRGAKETALQISMYGFSLGLMLHACTRHPDSVRPTYVRIISYLLEME